MPSPASILAPGVSFYIRHGQCRSNVEWPIEDYKDHIDGLTDAGIQQVRSSACILSKLLPDVRWRIITSTLTRAIQSGDHLAQILPHTSIAQDPRIIEHSKQHESTVELDARLDSFLAELHENPYRMEERVVIVTHGHVLESLLCRFLDAKIKTVRKPQTHNQAEHDGQLGLSTPSNGGISAFQEKDLILWNLPPLPIFH
jgi:broad specificity phosphatase PhoE